MHFFKKIIPLLLVIISFSCKTRLEKQGWQRTSIVSRADTSTLNRKNKELVVIKIQNIPAMDSIGKIEYRPYSFQDIRQVYRFNIFVSDSAGKIINKSFPIFWGGLSSKSDLAYYKWESDSVCLVKILNQGNVLETFKLTNSHNSESLAYFDERKK